MRENETDQTAGTPARTPGAPQPGAGKRAFRVLHLGDSEFDVLDRLRTSEKTGRRYEIVRVVQGAGAPANVAPYDAVILTFDKATEKAIDKLSRLQASAPLTPLIVVLNSDHDSVATRAIRCGAQDVLFRDEVTPLSLDRAIAHGIERLRRNARLELDAMHDELTGLPGRPVFLQAIECALEQAHSEADHRFALLIVNLDRFKLINDSVGPEFADQLLVAFTERVRRCLRPDDLLARLGGGELAILLHRVQGPLHAASVCQAVQREGMAAFRLGDQEVFTTVSIGVVCNDHPTGSAEDMLRDAGVAQHEGSRLGPGRYTIYEPRMHAAAVATFRLEMDLRRAVDRREFCLHYQPIVDLESGSLQGFEALLRWNHPTQGLVPPDRFIPLAEETGMIVPMERWVLREGCRTIRSWRNLLPPTHPLSLHVNISSKHLTQPDLAPELERTLQEFDLDPQWLRIEITETAIAENEEVAIGLLHELRSLGCLLSIDDFGTGYSSLACLQHYPVDLLKIDRAFIASLSENETSEEIVRLILVLADHFGLDAIAEGIETEEQLRVLREVGCTTGQGYLFSRPVDVERAEEFVRQSGRGIGLLPDTRSAAA